MKNTLRAFLICIALIMCLMPALIACDSQQTAEGGSETTPADTGCGSAVAGGIVMISLLGLGVYALARKRKDD